MTEQQDLPSDEPQENEISEELEADDTLELRLQALSAEYAHERAALAEQISQLQEENDRLTRRAQVLEQAAQLAQATVANDHHPERALGLDFSLPEE